MDPVYLSPMHPGWLPATEADLAAAAEDGLLGESHYLELKREMVFSRSKNREHARDITAFTLDGGALLVGVEEIDGATGALRLTPQPLAGLRERVEAIAGSIPEPPVSVFTRTIPSTADPTVGYLVVQVPPSGSAPHMVDGRYLGRGDTGKRTLSDPEVRRLHDARQRRETGTVELLAREFDRDPIAESERAQAHLFLLAEPLTPRPEMLLPHLHHQDLQGLLSRGAWGEETTRALGVGEKFSPELSSATSYSRRTAGAALSSYGLRSDRTVDPAMRTSPLGGAENIVEFEAGEDGAVRIFMGRLSDTLSQRGGPPVPYLFDEAAVVYVRRLLGIVAEISAVTGYLGGWAIGVGATGLRGLSSYETRFGYSTTQSFEENVYTRVAYASYVDLLSRPGSLADRLLGRFLRKLGTHGRYTTQLSNPPTPDVADLDL